MKVQKYEYERVLKHNIELPIPEETLYCFETGVRRSIRIIPKKITWEAPSGGRFKLGDVYSLDVTCVYLSFECRAERFTIDLHQADSLLREDSRKNSKEASILKMLLNEDHDLRTEEQFYEDFRTYLNKLATLLN